jgi:hypothetical protein
MMLTTINLETCAQNGREWLALMRGADKQMKQAHEQWIEGALKAADALYAARMQMVDHAVFGEWCDENGFNADAVTKDERAALIKIGADLPYWRETLAKTKSRSLRLITAKQADPFSQLRQAPPADGPATVAQQNPRQVSQPTPVREPALPSIDISEVVKKFFPLFSRLKATYLGEHGYGVLFIDHKRLAKIANDAKSLLDGWADKVLTEKLGPLFDVVRKRSQGRERPLQRRSDDGHVGRPASSGRLVAWMHGSRPGGRRQGQG